MPYPSRKALATFLDKAGMLVVLAILFVACSFYVDNFFSWANMRGLALAVSMTGMVACTMLFCLAAGDFDLSIGSVVACAGVLAAVVMNKTDSIALGVLAGLGAGALVGFINGYVVARLRINALITTLATMNSIQIVLMFGYLAWSDRSQFGKIGVNWRSSIWVGIFSVLGSAGWALAMTLENAALVRAVGQIELVFTFIASHLVLKERPSAGEWLGSLLVVGGVVLILLER